MPNGWPSNSAISSIAKHIEDAFRGTDYLSTLSITLSLYMRAIEVHRLMHQELAIQNKMSRFSWSHQPLKFDRSQFCHLPFDLWPDLWSHSAFIFLTSKMKPIILSNKMFVRKIWHKNLYMNYISYNVFGISKVNIAHFALKIKSKVSSFQCRIKFSLLIMVLTLHAADMAFINSLPLVTRASKLVPAFKSWN